MPVSSMKAEELSQPVRLGKPDFLNDGRKFEMMKEEE